MHGKVPPTDQCDLLLLLAFAAGYQKELSEYHQALREDLILSTTSTTTYLNLCATGVRVPAYTVAPQVPGPSRCIHSHPPMADQALPFDVLLVVMELSCPRTIAALMRTCRALYRDSKGPRLLLRNGAALATDIDILSFSAFMFASVPSGRFRHLRSLTVSKGGFSDDAVRVLASIVTHADLRLDSLALVDAEEVLSSGSPIWTGDEQAPRSALWDAFSWLPTLKHIKMTSIDERAHRLLDYLPNTLVSAMLAFDSPGAEWGALSPGEKCV